MKTSKSIRERTSHRWEARLQHAHRGGHWVWESRAQTNPPPCIFQAGAEGKKANIASTPFTSLVLDLTLYSLIQVRDMVYWEMVLANGIGWDGDILDRIVLGWALLRHVSLWDGNLDIGEKVLWWWGQGQEWCSGELRVAKETTSKERGMKVILPQIPRGTQPGWHLGLCSRSIRDSISVSLSRQICGTLLWHPQEPKAPSLSLLLSGEVKERIAQMTQKAKNLGLWVTLCYISSFPFSLIRPNEKPAHSD